jgi:hypothetical protein
MRRLAVAAVVVWVGRWAVRELACVAGTRFLPRGRAPTESPRQPGVMPGPFDPR